MLIRLLIIYFIINIITWVMIIIPWFIFYLKSLDDKCTMVENKTNSTIVKPTNSDNINYSEYISGEDFMHIFPDTYVSHTKQINEDEEIDTHRFYYHGKYLTKEEVIEKAREVLRRNINY